MSRTNWNRSAKNGIRSIATEKLTPKGYVNTAIMMPGRQLLCVKKAISTGLIRINKTILHIIEKDFAIANIIQRRMEQMGWKASKYHLHNCGLCDVRLPKGTKIEYAFLDTCGPISPAIIRWLHNNQSKFSNTARIGFTFCSHVRIGRELPHEINQSLTHAQKLECLKLLVQAEGNWVAETFGLVKSGTTKANGLVGWNNQQEIMRAIFAGIFCALSKSTVKPTIAIQYKESGHAVTMHYLEVELKSSRNVQNKDCRFSWIGHLAPEFVRVSANRSESARRAWVTRRKNQAKRRAA